MYLFNVLVKHEFWMTPVSGNWISSKSSGIDNFKKCGSLTSKLDGRCLVCMIIFFLHDLILYYLKLILVLLIGKESNVCMIFPSFTGILYIIFHLGKMKRTCQHASSLIIHCLHLFKVIESYIYFMDKLFVKLEGYILLLTLHSF